MRGFGKVGYHGFAGDVLPQRDGELGAAVLEGGRVEYFAQADDLAFGIWQFETHAGFAGNGFHNADGGYAEAAGQVAFQIQHRAAAHADVGFYFIARDNGAGAGIQHFDFDFVFGQLLFYGDAVFQKLFRALHGGGVVLGGCEQGERGQPEFPVVGFFRAEIYGHLLLGVILGEIGGRGGGGVFRLLLRFGFFGRSGFGAGETACVLLGGLEAGGFGDFGSGDGGLCKCGGRAGYGYAVHGFGGSGSLKAVGGGETGRGGGFGLFAGGGDARVVQVGPHFLCGNGFQAA